MNVVNQGEMYTVCTRRTHLFEWVCRHPYRGVGALKPAGCGHNSLDSK